MSSALAEGLAPGMFISANLLRPAGLVHQQGDRYLLTAKTLAQTPEDLAAVLVPLSQGNQVRVGDLGKVSWSSSDASSIYHGNGKPSVAVSLLRSNNGFAQPVIESIQQALSDIKQQFPNLTIEISDTQGRFINRHIFNLVGYSCFYSCITKWADKTR